MRCPIAQKDQMGCGVACVAYAMGFSYQKALGLFVGGHRKAKSQGFLCGEVVKALKTAGVEYEYKYVTKKIKNKIYKSKTIVFIGRSKKYPEGHYLCRGDGEWMDSWINFPSIRIKAGFRKKLPSKPIYAITNNQN